ncbi:MAG: hypothetical protein FJX59_00500 [Alphaproteobacteria bacterium]|nr:hypothetical protein [Alphaproteobacteria bacterium]
MTDPRPPRPRQGPRPLPLHLAVEATISQLCFAGLMPLNKGSLLSKPFERLLGEFKLESQKQPNGWPSGLDPAAFVDALTRVTTASVETLLSGVAAYHRHPFHRDRPPAEACWSRGAAALRRYKTADGSSPPAIFVPSLINRADILDLAEGRSLMRYASDHGIDAYLLDWGEPGAAELAFAIEDYVCSVLVPALEHVATTSGRRPLLVGYCMGGTLAMAPAVLRPDLISGLALLAAPWDFHAESESSRRLIDLGRPLLEAIIAAAGCAPIDLLQALFASLDPTLVGRKFRGFAALDPTSDAAKRFVELEDWLNDGIALAGPVAREALFDWYGANAPASRQWRVKGQPIVPELVKCATLAVIPSNDRIVPPPSALALATNIRDAEIRRLDLGHIGMMAGGSAPRLLYQPLTDWLKAIANR